MTRPEDIPADVWEMAHTLVHETWDTAHVTNNVARALLAYGQSRADAATERAARVCDEAAAQAENRSKDPHEWSSVKLSAGSVAWSLRHAATAIRSQK